MAFDMEVHTKQKCDNKSLHVKKKKMNLLKFIDAYIKEACERKISEMLPITTFDLTPKNELNENLLSQPRTYLVPLCF